MKRWCYNELSLTLACPGIGKKAGRDTIIKKKTTPKVCKKPKIKTESDRSYRGKKLKYDHLQLVNY